MQYFSYIPYYLLLQAPSDVVITITLQASNRMHIDPVQSSHHLSTRLRADLHYDTSTHPCRASTHSSTLPRISIPVNETIHYNVACRPTSLHRTCHFTVAAAFGNVHGVYSPGNVKLEPKILTQAFRNDKLVHGHSSFTMGAVSTKGSECFFDAAFPVGIGSS